MRIPSDRDELKTGRRAFLKTAGAFIATLPVSAQPKPPPRFGLQIYSLRYEASKDLPATLALIRKMGFEEVEVSGLYERSAADYRRLLDDNGLKAFSMMASYGQLDKDVASAADDAGRLGTPYVVCSTLPQKRYMTDEEARSGAEFLNTRGEALAKSDLRLCYHTHGTEFAKSPDGTIFDTLMKRTDPRFANFEMDIYWIVYAHQDPAKLLRRYPGRFPLMHVKDIRTNTRLGGLPRDVLEEESVPLGTGIVDIPTALRAARETGTLHYFIEDEAVDATRQIPISLRYLANMSW
ncbi:MAG: sugar phosphate isomerase/epimerase [Acidobacteria bacterium]|nr:sugar phosphate isomerase/epimerase [Acidobacteriota bacterium]